MKIIPHSVIKGTSWDPRPSDINVKTTSNKFFI